MCWINFNVDNRTVSACFRIRTQFSYTPSATPGEYSQHSEIPSPAGAAFQDDADDPAHLGDTIIWGTTVVVQTCMNIFRLFMQNLNVTGDDTTGFELLFVGQFYSRFYES